MADNPLYKTARWQAVRASQLASEPLCRFCLAQGRITPATVCDHVTPYRGDVKSFWEGPWQSLCATCHSSEKQSEELRGYRLAIGLDGFSIDPRHPFNGGRSGA